MLHLTRASRRLAACRSGDLAASWPSFDQQYTPFLSHLHLPLQQRWASDAAIAASSFPKYEELKAAAAEAETATGPFTRARKEAAPFPARVSYLVRSFRRSAALKERALGLFINNELYAEASGEYARLLYQALAHCPTAAASLGALDPQEAHELLFSRFQQFIRERYQDRVDTYAELVSSLDLRFPHLWYSEARGLRRKVVYHAGPTNSGKTYNALVAMRTAGSGVYCGPLRLLAMEVYDTLNSSGVFCNLLTGQERREVPGAQHTACTVEMASTTQSVDVAVIDEIQLIGDMERGWAWTRALLGIPATEIHVCGDGSAVELVQWLCEETGEEFELRTYDRFTPLEVESAGLGGDYSSVQPGDCIVAFSRRKIYDIKAQVEAATPHKAAVVYGALPPETRRQQARLFNDPNSAYSVLVASDAVGMGLNLTIRRIIFSSLRKLDGASQGLTPVPASMVKQIAGRAGRRGTDHSKGLVTCLTQKHIEELREGLLAPLNAAATPKAGLYPEFEHIEAFAGRRPEHTPFPTLLEEFADMAVLHGRYVFCRQNAVVQIAELLGGIEGLSLKEKYIFCMAPAATKDLRVAAALLHFARQYAAQQPCVLELDPGNAVPQTPEAMQELEAAYQIVALWLWLSYRFEEEAFPGRDGAIALGEHICGLLSTGLETITAGAARKRWSGLDTPSGRRRNSSKAMSKVFTPYIDDAGTVRKKLRGGSEKYSSGEGASGHPRKKRRQP